MTDYVWKRHIGFNFSWAWVVKVLCFVIVLFLVTYFYNRIKFEKYFPISVSVDEAGSKVAAYRRAAELMELSSTETGFM